MTENHVSLPDDLWAFAAERATQSGDGGVNEYLARLVEQDRRAQARKDLERSLVEALESGPITEMSQEDWRQIREEVQRRLAATSNP